MGGTVWVSKEEKRDFSKFLLLFFPTFSGITMVCEKVAGKVSQPWPAAEAEALERVPPGEGLGQLRPNKQRLLFFPLEKKNGTTPVGSFWQSKPRAAAAPR